MDSSSNSQTGEASRTEFWDSLVPMLWAVAAAFGTYFCMYAFRKPFSVAEYTDVDAWGWTYKTLAVSVQVLGYMTSKFIGIKVISELPRSQRIYGIVALIVWAEAALILFGLVPAPYNLMCLFLNGLPLGMIFGLVLSFLEGRRQTEALAAGLCTSFILADGLTKSVGKWLLNVGVSEFWMPAAAGAIFLMPLFGFVGMLATIKDPTEQDCLMRKQRDPMRAEDRRLFVRRNAWGLVPILVMFLLVTVLRSIRSDFAPEIWASLGVTAKPILFTYSEIWVGLAVTLVNGAACLIQDNHRAFRLALRICILGFCLLVATTAGLQFEWITPLAFMVLIGIGLYLPYVATHTTILERMIAMTKDRSNLVFLMYLADSIGYLGYVVVMLVRNVLQSEGDFMSFFGPTCYVVGIVSVVCMLVSYRYYARLRYLES